MYFCSELHAALLKSIIRGHAIPTEGNKINSYDAKSQLIKDVMQDHKDLTVTQSPLFLPNNM
jgi:hypothetical protein